MGNADPLPAMSVSVRVGPTARDVRSKPNKRGALDISLLQSKLEQTQREQKSVYAAKAQRNAVRNGRYVPQSAATQFAATSAPQPIVPGRKSSRVGKQEKRDSMSPLAREKKREQKSAEAQSPAIDSSYVPRSMSTSSEQNVRSESEREERGRSRKTRSKDSKSSESYQPGDAARRKSIADMIPKKKKSAGSVPASFDRPSSDHLHGLFDGQHRRASAAEAKYQPTILEEPEKIYHQKRVATDRPNWAQQSASNLHLPLFSKKKSVDDGVKKEGKPAKHYPESNHLIADAVKLIKQDERLKRRQSVIAFFKKL